MFGFHEGYKFTVECKSFYQTKWKFLGTPVYGLEEVDYSTFESESGFIGFGGGTIIEVEEVI